MIELLSLIREPHITEKSTRIKELTNTLCFRVDTRATKVDIRQAVERIFNVKVEAVRLVRVRGKQKRTRGFVGYRPGWKKAYVKLRPGQKSIEYFEGV